MRYIIILLIAALNLFHGGASAQSWSEREIDSLKLAEFIGIEQASKIPPLADAAIKAEIRIYLQYLEKDEIALVRLYKKDNAWLGEHYRFFLRHADFSPLPWHLYKRIQKTTVQPVTPTSGWTPFIDTLRANNIWSLPSKSVLSGQDKFRQKDGTLVTLFRGVSYYFRTKNDNLLRNFEMDNPKGYAFVFPDLVEVQQYNAIVNAIETALKIDFTYK